MMDTVDKLQAHLKNEQRWRINATKVAERHKMQVDKLKAQNESLAETLKNASDGVGVILDDLFAEIDQLKTENDSLRKQLHCPSLAPDDPEGFQIADYADDES